MQLSDAATWTSHDLTAFLWWTPIVVIATLLFALVALILGWLCAASVDAFQIALGQKK